MLCFLYYFSYGWLREKFTWLAYGACSSPNSGPWKEHGTTKEQYKDVRIYRSCVRWYTDIWTVPFPLSERRMDLIAVLLLGIFIGFLIFHRWWYFFRFLGFSGVKTKKEPVTPPEFAQSGHHSQGTQPELMGAHTEEWLRERTAQGFDLNIKKNDAIWEEILERSRLAPTVTQSSANTLHR